MAQLAIDTSRHAPDEASEDLPPGNYLAAITESDVRPNRNNTGQVLKLVLSILDGPHKGRKAFDNLNIQHQNAQAQAISLSRLSAICHALGKPNAILRDSVELHDQPLCIIVKPRKNGGGTEVKGYKAAKEAAPVVAAAPVAPTPPSTPQGPSSSVPWAAKAT